MGKLPPRKPRRASDRWSVRLRILEKILLIVSGLATMVFSAYIGQKSNDPALENQAQMKRIEEATRLRAENDRLKAENDRLRK